MNSTKIDQSVARAARILIVDDHPLVREGLANVIRREADLEVCGQAENHAQALELVETQKPHLVTVDLSLENSHGLELIKEIRSRHAGVKTLVVSMHDEKLYAERVIRSGASGYIAKGAPIKNFLEAVRQVLKGEIYFSQGFSKEILAKMTGEDPAQPKSLLAELSNRELQIFELIGDGFARRQIADYLKIDVNTVESYRARIKKKLNLDSAMDLQQYAIHYSRSKSKGD